MVTTLDDSNVSSKVSSITRKRMLIEENFNLKNFVLDTDFLPKQTNINTTKKFLQLKKYSNFVPKVVPARTYFFPDLFGL